MRRAPQLLIFAGLLAFACADSFAAELTRSSFHFYYASGTPRDRDQEYFSMNEQGLCRWLFLSREKREDGSEGFVWRGVEGRVKKAAVVALHAALTENRFFELEANYRPLIRVHDGDQRLFFAIQGGEVHRIRCDNLIPPELRKIVKVLRERVLSQDVLEMSRSQIIPDASAGKMLRQARANGELPSLRTSNVPRDAAP